MKRWIVTICIFLALLTGVVIILIVNPSLADKAVEEENQTQKKEILTLLNDYGDVSTIPTSTIHKFTDSFSPISASCGDVQVEISELLYDGVWMYTAAYLRPTDPNKVIVMPGAAEVSDPISGVNSENLRNDNRSFIDAAKEDKKRLVAVYVYPAEFDSLGEYFMDYRQLDGNTSVVTSGAAVDSGNAATSIKWSIQIYEIDLDTYKYTLLNLYESESQEVTPVSEIVYCDYNLADSVDFPIDSIRLAKTALTTYMYPHWTDANSLYQYDITMYSADGNRIGYGLAPDIYSVDLDAFPSQFTIALSSDSTERILFTRAD